MLWNNVNYTYTESLYGKSSENIKLVNLSSCTATQVPLILCMISKNSDLGVGGNVKFMADANFILINTKITTLNQMIVLELSAFKLSWYMEHFWYIVKSVTKSYPRENPEKQAKNRNFLISSSNYQRYAKFTSKYMFLWIKIRWN